MTRADLNAFCAALPATGHVVQWGGADVWKVGGKVFVIGRERAGGMATSFKVTPMAFEALRGHPDCRPAPYLASRGLSWIEAWRGTAMKDGERLEWIAQSHAIVAASLARKTRKVLGL